jgi:hypothetical protein
MEYHRHHILKCHACKSRRAMGGSKKAGRFGGAEQSGWTFMKNDVGAWIWLCPACARKHGPTRDRQPPGRKSDGGSTPARADPGARKG